MQLPNKLYSYHESVLSKFPVVLRALQDADYTVTDLYLYARNYIQDTSEFLAVLDCLYALNAIDYDESEEVLKYAD